MLNTIEVPFQTPAPNISPPLHIKPPSFKFEWDSTPRSLLRNLADLFRATPSPLHLSARPAPFWPDVFVSRKLDKRNFLISGLYHGALFAFMYVFPTLMALTSAPSRPESEGTRTLTYYHLSEYLPPIQSQTAPARKIQKGYPKYAAQPIISVPEQADNREQTILDPTSVKILPSRIRLPNLVVATPIQAAPSAAISRLPAKINFPLAQQVTVVQPAVEAAPRDVSKVKLPNLPQPSVVEPPPDSVPRTLAALNIARQTVQVEAPNLPVPEQRASGNNQPPDASQKTKPQNVPPAPNISGGAGASAAGKLLALALQPEVVEGPISVPGGNRHGEFASTPSRKPDAPGIPEISANASSGAGAGEKGTAASGAGAGESPGITVGAGAAPIGANAGAQGATVQSPASEKGSNNSKQMASLTPPHFPEHRPLAANPNNIEDSVFAGKKYYSLILNMPNLSSAGGSWVIRFAELAEHPAPGELLAPVALEKVDPAYPPQLIEDRIEGTVTLYAVIRSDGKVEGVRVLHSVDDRLDANARTALERWQFRPATKNGAPVDLEAVIQIPFKVRKLPF